MKPTTKALASNPQSGFTLIEVLIALSVLAVIGVAAASAASQYLTIVQRTQSTIQHQLLISNQLQTLKVTQQPEESPAAQMGQEFAVRKQSSEKNVPDGTRRLKFEVLKGEQVVGVTQVLLAETSR